MSAQSAGAPKKQPWKLRTRLAVGLGVLFFAVFALVAYSHFQYLNDRRDARVEDMQRVSQTLAAALDGLSHDLESFALSTTITLGEANLAIDQEAPQQTRDSVNGYLQHLFESYGLLRAIFITDTDGRVVFDNDGNSAGLDLSDRNYIKALQAGEPEYWSGAFPGSQTGETVVTHARPIVNAEGETKGYFVLALYVESLTSRLPGDITDKGHVSLVDKNGVLALTLPQREGLPIGADLSEWEAVAATRAGSSTVIRDESMPIGTNDRYGALTTVPNLGWLVSYSLPSSAVDGGTTDLFVRDIALLGGIVLLAFAGMWVFSDQTVRPLSRLTEVARGLSQGSSGDLTVTSSGSAEVRQLAETMVQMRDAIREREEQLRSQAAALEALEHLGESLASELDVDRAVTAIIDAGVELVGADAVQFVHADGAHEEGPFSIGGPRPSLALDRGHEAVRRVLAGDTMDTADADGAAAHDSDAPRTILGVPVRGRTGVVDGALLMLSARPDAYSEEQRRMATGLARWAAIVLENANLFRQSQELVAELEKSNAAKGDFIGIVSHELRTPITTIYGGALLLRLRRASLPEQAFNDMIVSISEESERLHHLVEDLLAIARTENLREPRPVDVGDVLHSTAGEFISTHKRPVQLDVPFDLPPAMADTSYLRQVVGNLISNADKYTAVELPIVITADQVDGEIRVRVMDSGPGVDADDLPRIFESFYRAKDAPERASGSGLGLTVCKRLVEAMGGQIWAQNRPEGGLEVGFTLPIADLTEEPQEPPAAHTANGGSAPESERTMANESVS